MNLCKFAACALVVREDGLILSVSRKDNEYDLGLPGGKFENKDITLENTAKRELREETGLVASISNAVPVFTAKVNNVLTTTFLFNSFDQAIPKQMGHGKVFWVTPTVLLYGSFGVYNTRLFNHINLNPALKGDVLIKTTKELV